jgi:hypothetical protein
MGGLFNKRSDILNKRNLNNKVSNEHEGVSKRVVVYFVRQMDSSTRVIPKDWVNLVRTKTNSSAKNTKRKAAAVETAARNVYPKSKNTEPLPPESMHDSCNNILSAICKANGNCIDKIILNLDPILSNVAYKDLVENLFGNESHCVAPVIPVITKAYEESFMREPMDSKVYNAPFNINLCVNICLI